MAAIPAMVWLKVARDVPVGDVIYKELTIRGVLSMPVDETFRAIDIIESARGDQVRRPV